MKDIDAILQTLKLLESQIAQQKEVISGQQAIIEALAEQILPAGASPKPASPKPASPKPASPKPAAPKPTVSAPAKVASAAANGIDWSQLVPGGPPVGPAGAPLINWVIGPPDNAGWAYGNNARRLASRLPGYRHAMSSREPALIAVYFDVIVADRFPVAAKHSIVRLGGPRPLDRLFGPDDANMAEGLAKFDVIVALSLELFRRVAKVHPNVRFIPNALDLHEWRRERRARAKDAPFTVGFAASLKSSKEIEVKGFDVAKAAAQMAGVKFIHVEKVEGKQVQHDRMIEDFYSKCDVIAHPVMPGREGTSNVVMEALSLGLPVITTTDCGFHGETLMDRRNGMIKPRDADSFAEAMIGLRDDKKLRQRISDGARQFVLRNHDLKTASGIYGRIISRLMTSTYDLVRRPSVCFVPFWMPALDFASSRIRAHYPYTYLNRAEYDHLKFGYNPASDIAIVVQSCDNDVFARIQANPKQFLIYDVCDRYYEGEKIFKKPTGDVNSLTRYKELVERADLLIVPTKELKVEISMRNPGKPVIYVPEPIDYAPSTRMFASQENRKVLWFGNPDRGNFESAKWMIEHLRDKYGYEPVLVSRKSFFKKYPDFLPYVVDWSPDAMEKAYKEAGICVLAHAPEEGSKSPNRFISAIMHGVPTVVADSPSCAEILRAAEMEFAIIDSPKQLDKAMDKLHTASKRKPFVEKLQRRFRDAYGADAIVGVYEGLFTKQTFEKLDKGEKLKVAFVSHNLSQGEGAPWSLCELAEGLNARHDIESFIYSPADGPLKAQYAEAGLNLTIFDQQFNHCVKVLNRRYGDAHAHFTEFLKENSIDVIVCNTVRAAPYVHMAEGVGVPSVLIIRESFGPEERYESYEYEPRVACEVGVAEASKVVFVSGKSREAWLDQHFPGEVRLIPNGISPARFAPAMAKTKAEHRKALGLGENEIIAVCVGTVNKRKGQEGILMTFAALPEAVRRRARIVFLGATENEYMQTFSKMIAGLPEDVRDRITVVPATLDAGPWYRASDIFLMNSTSEAYPRSVVEALYFGLPVLSTKVFGVLEQIQPGENGFLYDFDDMDAWATYFTRLVIDQGAREAMSAVALRSFWKLTTYGEMLHAYRALIGDAVRIARSHPAK